MESPNPSTLNPEGVKTAVEQTTARATATIIVRTQNVRLLGESCVNSPCSVQRKGLVTVNPLASCSVFASTHEPTSGEKIGENLLLTESTVGGPDAFHGRDCALRLQSEKFHWSARNTGRPKHPKKNILFMSNNNNNYPESCSCQHCRRMSAPCEEQCLPRVIARSPHFILGSRARNPKP